MSNSLNQIVIKYKNIFLAGDLNIDFLDSKSDPNNNFFVLRDLHDLKTLVKVPACWKNLKSTISDVPLTNKTNSLQKTTAFLVNYIKNIFKKICTVLMTFA